MTQLNARGFLNQSFGVTSLQKSGCSSSRRSSSSCPCDDNGIFTELVPTTGQPAKPFSKVGFHCLHLPLPHSPFPSPFPSPNSALPLAPFTVLPFSSIVECLFFTPSVVLRSGSPFIECILIGYYLAPLSLRGL